MKEWLRRWLNDSKPGPMSEAYTDKDAVIKAQLDEIIMRLDEIKNLLKRIAT